MLRSLNEHVQALAQYLPGGKLFAAKNRADSVLYSLLSGLAPEMLTIDNLVKTFRTEIPDAADSQLPDWERAVGIPDDCFPGSGTVDERRQHVLIKLASLGAQTTADFQALVDLFTNVFIISNGTDDRLERAFPLTLPFTLDSEPSTDDRFTLVIKSSIPAGPVFPLTLPIDFSANNEASIAECLVRKLAPANVEVIIREIITIIYWSLATASYDGLSFSVAAQDTVPQGVFFKDDGSKMYIIGATGDAVYQYSLSTAWDLSTASYDTVSFSVAAQETVPQSVVFSTDGSKMYAVGFTNKTVYQYSLSTPWDVSTASYASKSVLVSGQDTNPQGVTFSTDGSKMYVTGFNNKRVYQYTLSTAWDVSTASYAGKSVLVSGQDTIPREAYFKIDGLIMYLVGAFNDSIFEYALSTAWDVSTASYTGVSFSVTSQDIDPAGIFFKPNGEKMYVIGDATNTVYQYNTTG